jgi:hypothetical protein
LQPGLILAYSGKGCRSSPASISNLMKLHPGVTRVLWTLKSISYHCGFKFLRTNTA